MFYLYQSNRLESLASLFCHIQKVKPLKSALAAEEIVVQSQGMRRYLSSCLAKETGIAANLKFSLPAGLSWRLMRELIPDVPAMSPFSPEVMRWRLLALLRSTMFQTASEFEESRAALQDYLDSSESADYQLAGQLADIFDQYLVYRPQWIEAWRNGKLLGLGNDEIWQAQLWRFLDAGNEAARHRVALREQLLSALDKAVLPERFFVFGISTMAPMYLQLLQKISEHCDVFVFALNPCEQYWGNVLEAVQILNGTDDADLMQSGHPLLASLGKQGRDFFDFLSETEMEMPVFEEAFSDGSDTKLLHRLQYDIQALRLPEYKGDEEEAEKLLADGSIRIVSAHSPLRELQILKEHILHILQEHPDWQPHDIAVLTPDIAPYNPFIEAVFGQKQQGMQELPYSVSDVRISRRQPLLYAVEQLLSLITGRFEVDKVLALLESEPVLARFGLDKNDLPLIYDAVAEMNVHWGLDESARGGNSLFTWQQAWERMVLGWMMPDNGMMWQNISAWHGDSGSLDIFGRFAAFLETLADIAQQWQQDADVSQWVERVRGMMAAMFEADASDQYAMQQLEQSLMKWQQEVQLAQFDDLLPMNTVIAHLNHFLGSESQAGFLRSGITFCSMVPMRSLPFKVLCLLGLNDGDFPRNTKAAAFDLIARYPQKGDRARRDDDRYLFLEAIISAREILYLSYVGRSIRNDDELAPSALLNELLDTVAAMTGKSSKQLLENWVVQHPLQPFSRRYFAENSDLPQSLRQDYAEALNAAASAVQENGAFFRRHLKDEASEKQAVVSQSSFLAFWRNPLKTWLKQNLSWREPYREDVRRSDEPFEPEQNEKIAARYLEARREHHDFDAVAARLKAESLLPTGELGGLWQQRFQALAAEIDSNLLDSTKYPPFAYELDFDGQKLQGSLEYLHQAGQLVFVFKKPTAPDYIVYLLLHLIFCAVRPSMGNAMPECGKTYLLGSGICEVYAPIPAEQAREMLQEWLVFFNIGQDTPMPFFAKTGLAAAHAYLKAKDEHWDAAFKKAGETWRDSKGAAGKTVRGQGSYTEVALVFGKDETSPLESQYFRNFVENLLVPLLEAATQEQV